METVTADSSLVDFIERIAQEIHTAEMIGSVSTVFIPDFARPDLNKFMIGKTMMECAGYEYIHVTDLKAWYGKLIYEGFDYEIRWKE